jgi:beta-galactosidase/beta-glucuronidase
MDINSEDRQIPRPEYPRPQFIRNSEWVNLNGEWEFEFDDENKGIEEGWFDGRPLNKKIIVPFAYQTELSGINDKDVHEVVWYAKSFQTKEEWKDKDVLFHIGASDYRTSIWVNGKEVGHNQGGHVPLSFDIAPYLSQGENKITLRVEDRQDAAQPRGKQSVTGKPNTIFYYCTTGIWQTAWLEIVPQMRIDEIKITPIFDVNAFEIIVYLHAPFRSWRLEAEAIFNGEAIAEVNVRTGNATARMLIKIPNPEYWSPESPNLYDIKVKLFKGEDKNTTPYDEVHTYGGLRSITLKNGKIFLNNKPYFLKMVLDQGYWPESGLTSPSDEALRKDVELTKLFGFNGSRKHQKIEDPRWLYWCDKLGLFVWGEMANAQAWSYRSEEMLMSEWDRAVRRDYNHPCIITWVPVNESWGVPGLREDHPGQYAFVEKIVSHTRRIDRDRPIIDNDGWEHTDVTDICAIHDYTKTSVELKERYKTTLENGDLPPRTWLNNNLFARGSRYHGQPIVFTEVGGYLMIPNIPEEERDELYKFYGSINSSQELLQKYEDLMLGISELPFVSGFCYTQLTDIELEINGLLTYDRQPKIEPEKIKEIHNRFFR